MAAPSGVVEVVFRRSELYEQVWVEPVRTVARKYGVSDVALAKTCRKLRVPLPGVGHWAKVAAGRKVIRPALPRLPEGASEEIRRTYQRRPEGTEARENRGEPPAETLNVEADDGPSIAVPEELPKEPHRFVKSARRHLKEPNEWSRDGRMTREGRCLDVSVSPALLDRALRIFQGVLVAMEARGWKTDLTDAGYYDERIREWIPPEGKPRATRIRVDDEWVYLRVNEKHNLVLRSQEPPPGLRGRVLDRWRELNPPCKRPQLNGLLELFVECEGSTHSIREKAGQQLEEKLAELPQHLRWMAARAKQYRLEVQQRQKKLEEEAQQRQVQEHKKWVERQERERHEAEQREREKHFQELLASWVLARNARAYVRRVQALLKKADPPTDVLADLQAQLDWAREYADQIDPLVLLERDLG